MENIPRMRMADDQVLEETIKVEIIVNDKNEEVVFKKLSSGEAGKIRSQHVKTKYLAGQPNVTINENDLKDSLLCAAIVSAPFPHDLKGVQSLPDDVSTYLFTKWSEFSNPNESKKD